MEQNKKDNVKLISRVNGPVIQAKGAGNFAMQEMVYVGDEKLIGEVISIERDTATIQVYESTTGIKVGEEVKTSGMPLSMTLGPGLIGHVFDGIGRPLNTLRGISGDFISRGIEIVSLDEEKLYTFKPTAQVRR